MVDKITNGRLTQCLLHTGAERGEECRGRRLSSSWIQGGRAKHLASEQTLAELAPIGCTSGRE